MNYDLVVDRYLLNVFFPVIIMIDEKMLHLPECCDCVFEILDRRASSHWLKWLSEFFVSFELENFPSWAGFISSGRVGWISRICSPNKWYCCDKSSTGCEAIVINLPVGAIYWFVCWWANSEMNGFFTISSRLEAEVWIIKTDRSRWGLYWIVSSDFLSSLANDVTQGKENEHDRWSWVDFRTGYQKRLRNSNAHWIYAEQSMIFW